MGDKGGGVRRGIRIRRWGDGGGQRGAETSDGEGDGMRRGGGRRGGMALPGVALIFSQQLTWPRGSTT